MISKTIHDLYNWTLRIAGHRHATGGLAAVSFAESSFFPIPPDVVLIPMCVARRDRAFYYAFICTVSSVLGGLAGYAIGYFLYESIGQTITSFYAAEDEFARMKALYDEHGGWLLVAKGMTPIPYKIFTILSGILHQNLGVFIVASIVARAMRFYLVAALIWKYGAPIQAFIEKRLMLMTTIFLVLLIGGFVAIKYMV
jgi:membrane protein YqaA with SNARE-associated domain